MQEKEEETKCEKEVSPKRKINLRTNEEDSEGFALLESPIAL